MKTDIINWKEEYSVGLQTVDNQHKKFLGIINELGNSISAKNHAAKSNQLFFSLINFAHEYLFKEKILVNSVNNLDYSFFREKHNEFLNKLQYFREKYEQEESLEVFNELYVYLKNLYPEFLSYYTPSLVAILKQNGVH